MDAGCSILKQAAHNTNIVAGDGTTTSILLADCLLVSGSRFMSSGANQSEVRKGMARAREALIEFLSEIKTDISSLEQLKHVANVATNYNEELARIVADAVHYSGLHGMIHLEQNSTEKTELEVFPFAYLVIGEPENKWDGACEGLRLGNVLEKQKSRVCPV